MHAKTTFAGLFIKDNDRHVAGSRVSARHCWAVCDPRPGRAQRASRTRRGKSVWRGRIETPTPESASSES